MEVTGNSFPVVDQGELVACTLQLRVRRPALSDISDDRDDELIVAHLERAQTDLERKFGARPPAPAEVETRSHRPGPGVRGVVRPPAGVHAAGAFGQQHVDRHAQELVGRVLEELFDHRVDEDDRSRIVDDGDAIGSRVERPTQHGV